MTLTYRAAWWTLLEIYRNDDSLLLYVLQFKKMNSLAFMMAWVKSFQGNS